MPLYLQQYHNKRYDINDFSDISIVNQNISTIRQGISIYRQRLIIVATYIKRRLSKISFWTVFFYSLLNFHCIYN
ncbi:hypothetical protein COJ48_11450 [Bacillus cereus]|nr:hypothetical protein COJ48_11450 [Bacillus cereus]PGP86978.1 hypothetical protein CN997_04765 [Bacillus cereus]